MSKHTPGPWYHVGGFDKRMAPYIRVAGDQPGVAAVAQVCSRGTASEQRANAALIAAAPELADALRAAAAYVELFTGNGVRQQPPAWALKSDGEFDAEVIAARAREILAKIDEVSA